MWLSRWQVPAAHRPRSNWLQTLAPQVPEPGECVTFKLAVD